MPCDAFSQEYYESMLQTNNGEGDVVDVSRMVAFSTALDGVTDDYELTQVVQEFMAGKQVAKYFAIDRAVELWDGPSNFRERDDDGWTHNFFMYEEDDKTHTSREFHIVPWDTDGAFR